MEAELKYQTSSAFAKEMDLLDPLKDYRGKFYIPDAGNADACIYLTGNSLGLQPKSTRSYIEQELKDWETLGVKGHFEAKNYWLDYHELLTSPLAKLTGARNSEVIAMNSLTVNLHLMLVSFYRPTAKRNKIVIEKGAFPSDQYAVTSHVLFHGYKPEECIIELTPRTGENNIREEDIEELLKKEGDSIALIMLGGVNYYSGQAFDMQRITKAGHAAGCIVGFDLAHAIGNLELSLHDWDVDFAVWCSYKYLNGGPGSVGGCFVHERYAKSTDLPRFSGWWGHEKPTRFQMGPVFKASEGAVGWQLSNAPVLAMAALRASLDIFDQVGIKALREKSKKLTGFLLYLLNDVNSNRISIITPKEENRRGCQLSIRVKNADKSLFNKISEKGVVADWREPDVIRVAPTPLYNTFEDVYQFTKILKELTMDN